MAQITQVIYDRMQGLSSYTRHLLTSAAKRTTFDLGVNTLAQMALQRSVFPSIYPLRTLVDVATLSIIKPISYFTVVPSFLRFSVIGDLLSSGFAVSMISAYRFCNDPSYTLMDMAALTITTLPRLLNNVIPTLQKNYEEYWRQIESNQQLLDACRNGDVTKANNAFNNGANGFTETMSMKPMGNSCIKIAFWSKNHDLILLMLNKTKSHQEFWNCILQEVSFQQEHFPNNRNNMYWRSINLERHFIQSKERFFSSHVIIDVIFKKDNIKLFQALWTIAPDNVRNQGKAILKLALRNCSGKIANFLFNQQITVEQKVIVEELEKIRIDYNLTLNNFLPILIPLLLKLDGIFGQNYDGLKEYLQLTKLSSIDDLKNITGIDYLKLLQKLMDDKCFILEMATYLSLKSEKENFSKEDALGLRPLDYAILYHDNLDNAFFDFLIRCDKNIITLGERTALHLSARMENYYCLKTLLDESNGCFSNKKSNGNIVDLWNHGKIHRQLPWGRIEFVNRVDAFDLTPLHHVITSSPLVSLPAVDSLLKAGAKDICGSFVKSKNNPPSLSFLKEKMKEKMSDNDEFEFLQLTASELAEKNKIFCEENDITNNYAECIQLIKGEKTLAELTDNA